MLILQGKVLTKVISIASDTTLAEIIGTWLNKLYSIMVQILIWSANFKTNLWTLQLAWIC